MPRNHECLPLPASTGVEACVVLHPYSVYQPPSSHQLLASFDRSVARICSPALCFRSANLPPQDQIIPRYRKDFRTLDSNFSSDCISQRATSNPTTPKYQITPAALAWCQCHGHDHDRDDQRLNCCTSSSLDQSGAVT